MVRTVTSGAQKLFAESGGALVEGEEWAPHELDLEGRRVRRDGIMSTREEVGEGEEGEGRRGEQKEKRREPGRGS